MRRFALWGIVFAAVFAATEWLGAVAVKGCVYPFPC